MKMYEVQAKCGHVGRKNYVLKNFAILAENGREAALITRGLPRVKHHHKDAIREVKEINEERYREIQVTNRLDPYFSCHCVQDQRAYVEPDIYIEEKWLVETKMDENYKIVYFGKEKIRKPKRFIRNYCSEQEEMWGSNNGIN